MMLETRAIVVHRDEQATLVQASGANGCSACEGKGCGSSKLTQLFCSRPRQFKVENRINAAVGDEVIVSVAEGAVMRGISLVYLLPLALMFAGAAAGWYSGGYQDGYAALGALFGLIAGFLLARRLLLRGTRQQPYIARTFSE